MCAALAPCRKYVAPSRQQAGSILQDNVRHRRQWISRHASAAQGSRRGPERSNVQVSGNRMARLALASSLPAPVVGTSRVEQEFAGTSHQVPAGDEARKSTKLQSFVHTFPTFVFFAFAQDFDTRQCDPR